MNPKCGHCSLLTEDRECPGQKNDRVCYRANPTSVDHAPGIVQKLLSFGHAIVQHLAVGAPMATKEQINARLAICQACEHFDNGGCRKCGCGPLKLAWADQACPIGKWGPVNPQNL